MINRFYLKLQQLKPTDDLKVAFYTIDPLPFFHKDFLGLTYALVDKEKALGLEISLALKSVLTPLPEVERSAYSGDYSVGHGVMLYLLNPLGRLQAVLRPNKSLQGVFSFDDEQLLKDYLAIREFKNKAA